MKNQRDVAYQAISTDDKYASESLTCDKGTKFLLRGTLGILFDELTILTLNSQEFDDSLCPIC
jgi:hypothetical protein